MIPFCEATKLLLSGIKFMISFWLYYRKVVRNRICSTDFRGDRPAEMRSSYNDVNASYRTFWLRAINKLTKKMIIRKDMDR